MLPTTHSENKVERPRFEKAPRRGYEGLVRVVAPVYQSRDADDVTASLGDAGEPDIHDLVRRCMDRRDTLTYRRLRGESLTPREAIELRILNVIARRVLPPTERLPSEARDAIEQVRRLRARQRSG